MFSFAEVLANNCRLLKALKVVASYNEDSTNITLDGYMAFTSSFCNSSSIMSTYHSNHTLKRIWPGSDDKSLSYAYAESGLLPEGLISLLRLNRDNSVKAQHTSKSLRLILVDAK